MNTNNTDVAYFETSDDVTNAIEKIFDYADEIQREASASSQTHLAAELRLAKSLVVVLVLITSALHFKKENGRLYPRNWLSPEGMPDPDDFLSLGFCQLANYAYATVDLIEKGLDTPARALVRTATELGQILVVIANDREAFRAYTTDHSAGDKQKWYDLFSPKKMAKRLAQLERSLGIPEAVIAEAREWREDGAEFFSQAIHHSFHSIVLGGKPSIPGTSRVELSLLGGPNGASGPTIYHLIVNLNMCLTTFFRVVADVHQFKPTMPNDNAWWQAVDLFTFLQPDVKRWLFGSAG